MQSLTYLGGCSFVHLRGSLAHIDPKLSCQEGKQFFMVLLSVLFNFTSMLHLLINALIYGSKSLHRSQVIHRYGNNHQEALTYSSEQAVDRSNEQEMSDYPDYRVLHSFKPYKGLRVHSNILRAILYLWDSKSAMCNFVIGFSHTKEPTFIRKRL